MKKIGSSSLKSQNKIPKYDSFRKKRDVVDIVLYYDSCKIRHIDPITKETSEKEFGAIDQYRTNPEKQKRKIMENWLIKILKPFFISEFRNRYHIPTEIYLKNNIGEFLETFYNSKYDKREEIMNIATDYVSARGISILVS